MGLELLKLKIRIWAKITLDLTKRLQKKSRPEGTGWMQGCFGRQSGTPDGVLCAFYFVVDGGAGGPDVDELLGDAEHLADDALARRLETPAFGRVETIDVLCVGAEGPQTRREAFGRELVLRVELRLHLLLAEQFVEVFTSPREEDFRPFYKLVAH